MASTYELIVQAVDKTSRPLGNIERSLGSLDKRANTIGKTLKTAGAALAAFATGNAIRSIVNTTARFEDFRDTLDTVTGSAREGGRAMDFITKFATKTQFGIEDLTNTFIKLKGAGIQPTQSLLTTFTDTAAVTTDQIGTLNAMADLFSRTTAGGLGLEELNRLADRGVPVFRILEEQLGLTRLEISDFGKSAEGAEKIRKALQAGLNESFGGATAGKLDNLSTGMSNFGIEVGLAAAKIGNEFRPQLTKALNDATLFLQENEKLLKVIGQGMGVAIESTSKSLKILADNFNIVRDAALAYIGVKLFNNLQKTTAFFNKATGNSKSFGAALGVVGKRLGLMSGVAARAAGRFGGLSTAFALLKRAGIGVLTLLPRLALGFAFANPVTATIMGLYTAFQLLKDRMFTIGGVTTNLSEIMKAAFFGMGNIFRSVSASIAEIWGSTMELAQKVFEKFSGVVGPILTNITTGFKSMGNFVINVFRALGSVASDLFKTMGTNAGLLGQAMSASFARFQTNFQGYTSSIKTVWLKTVKFLAEKFANFVSETGSVFNQAAELLGFDPVFNTMGIQAWASSFDGAIMRSENRTKEMFENGEIYAQQAADSINQMSFLPNTNFQEIFNSTPIDDFTAKVTTGMSVAGESIAGMVTRYREHNQALEDQAEAIKRTNAVRFLQNESMQAATEAARLEAETIQAQKDRQQELAAAYMATHQELKTFDNYLKNLISTSAAEVTETNYAMQAKAALRAELDAGRINLDTYALAVEQVNQQLGITNSVAAAAAEGVAEVSRQLSGYEQYLNRVTESANRNANEIGYALQAKKDLNQQLKDGKISLDAYAQAMEQINRTTGMMKKVTPQAAKVVKTELKKTAEVAKTTADIIRDGFKQAGDSLTKDLATALRTGSGVMDSFKNYFNSALDSILQGIIQKNITGPLTQQLNGLVDGMLPGGELGGGMIKSMGATTDTLMQKTSTFGQGFKGLFGNIFSGVKNMFGGFGSSLTSMFSGLFSNLGGMLQGFGGKIGGFFSNLFGGGGGGGGLFGSLFSGIGGLFSGGGMFGGIGSLLGFADGGYPPVNRPSIVGERGPELFVPTSAGRVVPNNELGGGGGATTVVFELNAISTRDGVEFLLENKPAIIQMVQQASNKRGRAGILD